MKGPQKWSHAQRGRLFEEIPCGIVVIDRALNVVDHNHAFAQVFGEARGRQCFAAIRGRTAPCQDCPAEKTFADAKPRVREQTGQDVDGRPSHHLMQITPIVEPSGEVEFVVATAADLSATKRLQREYQTLFEKVPCYVAVINRDYRVVKANEMFRRVFGEPTGEHCYSLFKRRQQQCESCPAEMTFRDEKSHTSQHVGVTLEGEPSHYVVSTAPLLQAEGRTSPRHRDGARRHGDPPARGEAQPGEPPARDARRELARRHRRPRSQPPGDDLQPCRRGALGVRTDRGRRAPGAGPHGPDAAQGAPQRRRRALRPARDRRHHGDRRDGPGSPGRGAPALGRPGRRRGRDRPGPPRDQAARAREARRRAPGRRRADRRRAGSRHQEHPHRARGRDVRRRDRDEEGRRGEAAAGLGDAGAEHGPDLGPGQEPARVLPG